MSGDLTWFKFRSSWIKVFKTLSKPEIDRLFDAIDAYNNDRKLPDMVGRESVAWAFIESELDADKKARRKAADAHKEAGVKGGRPKTNLVSEETKITNLVFQKPNENPKNQNDTELRVKELRDTELREIERDKRENARSQKDIKHRHGNFQHVFLTDDEYNRLKADFSDCEKLIQNLDDYLENNPSKHYANHNLTIRNWVRRDAEKKPVSQQKNETWIEAAERVAMSDPFFPADHIEVLP